jgi:hypothetical protein
MLDGEGTGSPPFCEPIDVEMDRITDFSFYRFHGRGSRHTPGRSGTSAK